MAELTRPGLRRVDRLWPRLTDVVAKVVRWASRGANGYMLSTASVALGVVALRLGVVGRFQYLPLIPAVLAPALLGSRGPTILAIGLAVMSNIILVQREELGDTIVYALSFAAIGLAVGEMATARRSGKASAAALASELKRRDATLQAMLASTPVATLDAQGLVLTMSRPACALFRTTEHEAAGRTFKDFVASFDAWAADTGGKGDSPLRRYWMARRSDGNLFPVGIRVAYVDAHTRPSRVVLTLTDLTDRHAAEARNQELSEQLNQVWPLNSLGEMAAILSHELNQPLSAAAIYMQAAQTDLARTPFIDNASRTLDLAKGQALRAGEVIRHARDLLKVGSKALKPERMTSMLFEIGPMLKLIAPAADAMIRIDICGDNDLVMADRIPFQQAVINLVRNAVEAVSGRDRREVHVLGHVVSATHYEIRVEDSGPGVPPEEIERIFTPLTTTKADGMGLGLSVTRTIVEAHHSALTVATSPLGGAVFAFRLQRAQESRQP
ncbi:PAS domain-containing sensor histidine kinase [Brevundimonas sp. TWP2-3-4b1]|uniref:PAS domain-containing sensor histidine kinase n=1 Tax=Brevundimonas sp. TWP2-3-4b1 TaxID=2804580 RepID=UPI003CEDE281